MAGRGEVCCGVVMLGTARYGMEIHGLAGWGLAWRSEARQGEEIHGKDWRGRVWHRTAGRSKVRKGVKPLSRLVHVFKYTW